jgi:hypothetical protein
VKTIYEGKGRKTKQARVKSKRKGNESRRKKWQKMGVFRMATDSQVLFIHT